MKVRSWRLFVVVLLVLALGLGYLRLQSSRAAQVGVGSTARLTDQRKSAGGVDVTVRPIALGDAGGNIMFSVKLNTHSVDLDYDLAQTAILRCDRGDEHSSLGWQGTPPGGHHRQGDLQFSALDHSTVSLELVLRDVGGVSEQVFHWDLAAVARR